MQTRKKTTRKEHADYDIIVYDVDGSRLHNCSKERAHKFVDIQKSANWVAEGAIQLTINRQIRTQMRKQIKRESNRICYICGEWIGQDEQVTIDHVKPRSKNGRDTFENQKCCCYRCNQSKFDMELGDYLAKIEAERSHFDYISDEQLEKLKAFYQEFQTYQNT